MTDLGNFSEAFLRGDVTFFCGSGISCASGLPSADQVLRRTASALLPALSRDQLDEIVSIQPEVFYETIINASQQTPQRCLALWLALHPLAQRRYGVNCVPSYSHIAISEYASKHKRPIFTTNFDTLFERACEMLGKEFIVYSPLDKPPSQRSPHCVSIIKLHGTIRSLGSMFTTMTHITKLNRPWLDFFLNEASSSHICILGYSGRDLDLFETIAIRSISAEKQTFWINKFADDPSDAASRRCNAIRIEDMYPDDVFKAMGSIKVLENTQETATGIAQLLNDLSVRLAKRLALVSSQQELLYGLLLTKAGLHRASAVVIDSIVEGAMGQLTPVQRCLALLSSARLAHETGRYVDSLNQSRKAVDLSRTISYPQNIDYEIQAVCQEAEAFRMLAPGNTYFFTNSVNALYQRLRAFVIFSFILLKLKVIVCARVRHNSLLVSTQHELIETKIRFRAMI